MHQSPEDLNESHLFVVTDLPWEDVLFPYVFKCLDTKTLFRLRMVSTTFHDMIRCYFRSLPVVNLLPCARCFTTTAFLLLTNRNTNIYKLVLRNCQNFLNDQVLKTVLEENSNLCYLDLTGCTTLTNSTMQTLAVNCTKLNRLYLGDCVWITPEAATNIALHCPLLEELDLSGCWNINDDTLVMFSSACPRLSYVNISRIYGITDKGVTAIAQLLPNIKELNIRDCWRVTDDAICLLETHARLLKVLQCQGCTAITEQSLIQLQQRNVLIDAGRRRQNHSPAFSRPGRRV